MSKIQVLILICCFVFSQITAQNKNNKINITVFPINKTSIRAIQVVNDSTIWFAGSNGKYGKIVNSKIQIDSIIHNNKALNFRSIAYNGKHIFILSIENPAVLYKINTLVDWNGEPKIVYQENNENVFYDAMVFVDSKNGIAMGDPITNCLSVIVTNNGGDSWNKLKCNNLPKSIVGEAAFAASDSNITFYKNKVWMVTGGKRARIFVSDNLGIDWEVYDTPISQGEKMTGIFTVDFYNENIGIIMGGNWEDKKNTKGTKALTFNGGKTWELIDEKEIPGYISCVKYIPNTNGNKIMAVSTEGIYYSNNKGYSWEKCSDEGYFNIKFVNKNTAWLSGNQKIAKLTLQ